jgi:hypothetical protein
MEEQGYTLFRALVIKDTLAIVSGFRAINVLHRKAKRRGYDEQ